MKHLPFLRLLGPAASAVLVASCSTTALPPEPPAGPGATPGAPAPAPAAGISQRRTSAATNARAYRQDAATHVYGLNQDRIWKGRLPPMLYAIGVLQVEVDRDGQVRQLHWMRAPRHAPEVVAEIERTVRSAAPFPAPVRMGKVVWTDTWLWDKSGKFQLDTLSEGQD